MFDLLNPIFGIAFFYLRYVSSSDVSENDVSIPKSKFVFTHFTRCFDCILQCIPNKKNFAFNLVLFNFLALRSSIAL